MSLLLNTAAGSHTWPRRLMLRDLAQTVCKGASRRSSPRATGFVDLLPPWPPLAHIPILPCLTIVAPLHSVHGMRVGPEAAVQVALEAAREEARLPARPGRQGAWASGPQTGGRGSACGGACGAWMAWSEVSGLRWTRRSGAGHTATGVPRRQVGSQSAAESWPSPHQRLIRGPYLVFEPTELSAAERDTAQLPGPGITEPTVSLWVPTDSCTGTNCEAS